MLLLVASLPFTAFGQDVVSLKAISNKAPGEDVKIEGTSTLNEVTIKVITPDNTILYVDAAPVINGLFASEPFTLPLDANGTYTVVVGQGKDVKTTEFTVNNGGTISTNANLSGIVLSTATLDPAFTSVNTNYTVNLPASYSDSVPQVTATTEEASATLVITQATAIPGTATVVVTAQDGITSKTYTISIKKDTTSSGGGGGGATSTDKTVTLSGGTVTDNGVTVEIPADAVKSDIKIRVEKVAFTSSMPIPEHTQLAGDVFEIEKDKADNFGKSVTITLPFDKSKIDLNKYEIAIYWFDENEKKWVKLSNVKVDLESAKVSGDVDHFTKFAVLATEKFITQPTDNGTTVNLTDITGQWAEANIKKLCSIGAINGYPDNSFKPNDSITRAEFATVLVKALKLTPSNGKVFDDTATHWAKDYISTAAANGFVNGYSDSQFGPNDLITREQMAVMIAKAVKLGKVEAGTNFADRNLISTWATDAVAAASENNIISGYPDNTFKPSSSATRAEAVTVIVRALKL